MTALDALPPSPTLLAAPALEVSGLHKRFGRSVALAGAVMTVPRGSVQGLVGRNGAGKSTLLRIVLGLVAPDGGEVRVHGRPVAGAQAVRAGVCGFPDAPAFPPFLTGRRALGLLAGLDGAHGRTQRRADVDAVLEQVGLTDAADRKVAGWSLGMRQRLGIAAALLRRPSVLVLDEPLNGLDPAGTALVHDLLRGLAVGGTTVVLSSHDMASLDALCDRVTILADRRTAFDGPLADLVAFAPAARHRLTTSDDRAASAAAAALRIDVGPHPRGGLRLYAHSADVDTLTLALGRGGIAVRSLTLERTALEQAFLAITGEEP